MTRDELRAKSEALAAARGQTRAEAEAWAIEQYLSHLVKAGRMALMHRVATPLQTAKVMGGHRTELDALAAALAHVEAR